MNSYAARLAGGALAERATGASDPAYGAYTDYI